MEIYDTLSRGKKKLPPPGEQKNINLFVCGPTVYDYLHIGNARTYVFFDFFAKYLRSQGYEVNYLQNITNIDDKIIKRAAEENKKPEEIANFFTEAYLDDMKALGVDAVSEYAPAMKFIPEIISQVEGLIKKGFAYKIDGDGWYFDIAKDADYGKLSGRTVEQAEDGVSRIDYAIGKRNKGDFCLWKFSKSDEPSWPSESLGAGRPGWHIEDTATTEKIFGPQYDIHGGGVDLKFPHHEAEIAQQESLSGKKPLAKIWMHTGTLLADGKKMSKSLGNFVTIRDFLKENDPEVLRWITLSHHYLSPVNYSQKILNQSKKGLSVMKEFLAKLEIIEKTGGIDTDKDLPARIQQDKKDFFEYLSSDANTPLALGSLFVTISRHQDTIWKYGAKEASSLKEYLKEALELLGLSLQSPQIPAEIQQKAANRELSRASKQFDQSDLLRREINDLGYEVEDTPVGPFLWPKV